MNRVRPLLVGLTGSIGMGKSTTAAMFGEFDIPVWDADAAVARAYQPNGRAIKPMKDAFPNAVSASGVDRLILREMIADDPSVLSKIESIVHPLIQKDREQFIETATAPILLFDIPLLFETGAEKWLDVTIVVTCGVDEQEKRVMARPGMTKDRFNHFLSMQMPDDQKQSLASYVILTNELEATRNSVNDIVEKLNKGLTDA